MSLLDQVSDLMPYIEKYRGELFQKYLPMKLWASGASYKDISIELNLPIGTVKSRIHRGKHLLNRLAQIIP